MKSTLKPFQKATLKWMEKRENVEGGEKSGFWCLWFHNQSIIILDTTDFKLDNQKGDDVSR